ncbi:MAG: helix-turn-helix domain-containing protein [Thermoguttaceae bacterium]
MTTNLEAGDLLTKSQAAKLLSCSLGTISNLIIRGDLRAVKFGTKDKVVRIHREDVNAFFQSRCGKQDT